MSTHTPFLLFFLCLTRCTAVYEDARRHIYSYVQTGTCQRCGAVIEIRGRVLACYVRGERLCFTCYHRVRWPR